MEDVGGWSMFEGTVWGRVQVCVRPVEMAIRNLGYRQEN